MYDVRWVCYAYGGGGRRSCCVDPLQPPATAPRARLPFDRLVLLPLLWCAAYYLIILLPAGESDLMPSMRYIVVGLVLALLALDWVDHFLVHGVRRRLGAPALIVLRGALIVRYSADNRSLVRPMVAAADTKCGVSLLRPAPGAPAQRLDLCRLASACYA